MPPLLAGQWHSLLTKHAKIWRRAAQKAAEAIEARLTDATRGAPKLQPIPLRNTAGRPQLHHLAPARRSQDRWISTSAWKAAARHYSSLVGRSSGDQATAAERSAYLKTSIASHISRSTGRAPFASTLRPNLTGGTLARSSGGYTLGSGRIGAARYFSHGPASPAHVVQNVSQGLRAFLLSGSRAQYCGTDPTSGEKRYRAVSTFQHDAITKMHDLPRTTPGSHIDFRVNPTITALTSLGLAPGFPEQTPRHLNSEGLLDFLSEDFSRSLKDLSVILSDLKRLATLGDLLITYHDHCLRIHFPGVDAETVESLCSDLDIQRGLVTQDPGFEVFAGTETALRFPFAPDAQVKQHDDEIDWRTMLSTPSRSLHDADDEYSTASVSGFEDLNGESESVRDESWASQDSFGSEVLPVDRRGQYSPHDPLEYQGLEGIYRFIQQCDTALPMRR